MVDSFWFCVAVGTVLGVLAGLGVGGGSLLILWLTIALDYSQSDARGMNLLFFLPAASLSLLRHPGKKNGKHLFPALVTGPAAALLASWIGMGLDTQILKKGFGILLLITGVRELFYKPKN